MPSAGLRRTACMVCKRMESKAISSEMAQVNMNIQALSGIL